MSSSVHAPATSSNEKTPPRQSSFAALHHRDFRLLWLGQIVSTTGSQMQLAAINWHVYLLTKSSLALGLIGLVRVVPIILCSLLGGVVADAVDRKRMILATQTLMMLSAGVLAIVTGLGLRSVWPIYLLTAIGAAAFAFDNPARQALLPSLVPAEIFPNAVSLGLIAFHIATVGGPALAGLILASHGPTLVYALNAVSFLAVIVAVLLMRVVGRAATEKDEASRVSVEALREGLRFVWRTPIIVQTMTLDFIATFFASATALLPIFAAEILHVGARGFGILQSAPAAGSVITAFVMARLGMFRRQGLVVILSIAVYGAATLAFGLSRVFWFSLLMLALTGAADTVSTVLRQTIRQLVTPNNLRGRMTSINMMFFMGGPQLGELEAGALAAIIGASRSVMTGGVGCIVAVVLALIWAKNLIAYDGVKSKDEGAMMK
jgi:MFS family permease